MAVVICGVVALPAAASATSAPRGVVRTAVRLSGLPLRHAVRTATVSSARLSNAWRRDCGTTLRASMPTRETAPAASPQAWYDASSRRLLVRRSAPRGVVLNEVVRALIDQNYGLRRLAVLRTRDRDAWLAARGIVDGTAALASRVRTNACGDAAPGRALAAQLRYLGGNAALATALRTFPQTTEQLLHVDKFLGRERAQPVRLPQHAGGATLSSAATFGELDVRTFLQTFGVREAAVAAAGWGGGRLALYDRVTVILLHWDSPEDAAEWQAAMPAYARATLPGVASRTCPPLDGCWGDAASGTYGTTSVLAVGPGSADVAAALLTLN